MSKKYYYCELCDYMCDTYYFHVSHTGSINHMIKCDSYKNNLIKDDNTLEVFRKILKDETNIEYQNNKELCNKVIMYLSNHKLTFEQIKEIKNKNNEFEIKIMNLK